MSVTRPLFYKQQNDPLLHENTKKEEAHAKDQEQYVHEVLIVFASLPPLYWLLWTKLNVEKERKASNGIRWLTLMAQHPSAANI